MSSPHPKQITDDLTEALGDEADLVEDDLNDFLDWMLEKGKNPVRKRPLSPSVSSNYHDRIDQLYRMVITHFEPDTVHPLMHSQADNLIRMLDHDEIVATDGEPYDSSSKRKFSNALQKYFLWRYDLGDCDEQWEPRINFSDGEHDSADKLSFKERWMLQKAALEYGSLPPYYETEPEERDRLKGLVAQRLGKPKEDVTKEDWERPDTSNKIGSLVLVGFETGMIPKEVREARINWYDQKRNIIKIPKEYAAKNRPTIELPLSEETGEILSKWIQERRHYEEYDGTNRLWLNGENNSYNSGNLCNLISRLCEEAGIDDEDRKIVWYSLRHNLGQTIQEEGGLSQARDQLRHWLISTTKSTYGESMVESRRQTLEKINEVAQKTAENPDFSPFTDEPPKQKANYPDEVESTSTGSGGKHIDVYIEDTQEARVDLAQKLLSEEM